jgi:hypothetical protein
MAATLGGRRLARLVALSFGAILIAGAAIVWAWPA